MSGHYYSQADLSDPWADKDQQVASFFAKGLTGAMARPCSRPTLHGQTNSQEIVSVFLKLIRKVESVRGILADAMERKEIRSRILERDPSVQATRLG